VHLGCRRCLAPRLYVDCAAGGLSVYNRNPIPKRYLNDSSRLTLYSRLKASLYLIANRKIASEMGQGQSQPPRPSTPEPEISPEERAQAQAEVNGPSSPLSVFSCFFSDITKRCAQSNRQRLTSVLQASRRNPRRRRVQVLRLQGSQLR
jgi:hypothetical protein